ncbi:antigen 5 like allergen Cul n 1-like [Uranotaenia lowii]|uniref:antigen 5 like allergen Cul n 1-like n=1 Tax=Uranotaenia lowii TaxID=190385 RepID=UPI00247965C3|nr:antigen 5 like allergen Cul n 1-like [Uranotaenia lowii]
MFFPLLNRSISALVLSSSMLIGVITAYDYCANTVKLCKHARVKEHIGCNAYASFGPKCGDDARIVFLNWTIRGWILDQHNQLRSGLALGDYGFPTAARMATLEWDAELALVASFKARTCIFEHDFCRNTERFITAGQNILITSVLPNRKPLVEEIMAIDSFFSEYKDATVEDLKAYPRYLGEGPMIGHFTQIGADRANRVGCSLIRWKNSNWYNYMFVCNYSMNNIEGQRIYDFGPTGSGCITGTNPDYPGLCSTREPVSASPYLPNQSRNSTLRMN